MSNLKLVPAVKKLFCPNCGEDFISGPMGVPICPSCDVTQEKEQSENKLPFTNEKEFIQLVKVDLLRDDDKDPILRTPEVLLLWQECLLKMLQEANERVGSINLEVKRCSDESAKKQLSYSLSTAIGFRSKIQTRLFEADRLLGSVKRQPVRKSKQQPQEVSEETSVEAPQEGDGALQLENLKNQVKSLEGKVKQKENELQQLRENYQALKNGSEPDAIVFKETHAKLQSHTLLLEKQSKFYRIGLNQIKDYLLMGECNPEFLLKVIRFRLDTTNMAKGTKGEEEEI